MNPRKAAVMPVGMRDIAGDKLEPDAGKTRDRCVSVRADSHYCRADGGGENEDGEREEARTNRVTGGKQK